MIIIAGLGNPTEEYSETRHNIGYKIVSELANKLDKDFANDSTTYRANQYLKTKVGDLDLVLTLPLGYMNNSGEAINQVLNFYGEQEIKDLWIVHDDTEIPFGEIRVKFAGSSAGHNGVKSIDQEIGDKYWRIRVGVGRPDQAGFDLARYVLGKFSEEERQTLPAVIDQTVAYLLKSLRKGKLSAETFNAKNNKKKS